MTAGSIDTGPRETTIRARGLEFGALEWGETDGPLALLIHGYPDTAWTWRHLGPALATRGWRVVAPFTRGYAPTGFAPDDDYRASEQAKDIIALHQALEGNENAVLVGHDWGAVATWVVAATDPQRFRKLVAMSVPPPAAILEPFRSWRTLPLAALQLRMSWYFIFNQLPFAERALPRLIPKLWKTWSPGYDAREDLAHIFDALNGPPRRRAALRYYRNSLTRGLPELASTRPVAPALYLHGSDDGCVRPEIGSRFADRLPAGSTFRLVTGAGHFLHLEQPATVNDLILGWLEARAS